MTYRMQNKWENHNQNNVKSIGFRIFVMKVNKIPVLFEDTLLWKMNVYFVYCCSTVDLHV